MAHIALTTDQIQCPRYGHDDEWVGLICDFCGTCRTCGLFSAEISAYSGGTFSPCRCADFSNLTEALTEVHDTIEEALDGLDSGPLSTEDFVDQMALARDACANALDRPDTTIKEGERL